MTGIIDPASHIWNAEVYHCHSSIQFIAASKLLGKLDITACKQIIDLGCGDGKITAEIAKRLSNATVIGIDVSQPMIDIAKRLFPQELHPNLTFMVKDIRVLDHIGHFDFVCSFFALQWIEQLDGVFKNISQSLKPNGIFALIVPLHISLALNQAIEEIVALPEWSQYFQDFTSGWYFRSPSDLQSLLLANHFKIRSIAVVPQEMIFSTREDLEKFVLPWLTYLDQIPNHLKDSFLQRLFDRYIELEPCLSNGSTVYKYSYIEIIAEKI